MKTLSTTEAARILGVTRERVRQLCDEKKLKAEKLGRDWRIMPRAVEEYQRKRDLPAAHGDYRKLKPINLGRIVAGTEEENPLNLPL